MPTHPSKHGALSVLVTGGAGFIGSHLCTELVAHGYQVRVLDLLTPKKKVPGVQYMRGDIRKVNSLAEALSGVDAVYHLAAIVSVPECQKAPAASYETNFTGTLNLLEAIRHRRGRKTNPIRVYFASSAAVYGNASFGSPSLETRLPIEMPSFYASQKFSSEQVIRLYCQNFEIPSLCFRFFNVYGPGQKENSSYSGVISIFLSKIRTGQPIELHGGGTQTRDFIAVEDVARACSQALSLSEKELNGASVNIGTGNGTSILNLAHTLLSLSRTNVSLEPVSARSGDVHYSVADVSLAKSLLDWQPRLTLAEGLAPLLQGQTRLSSSKEAA